MAGSGAHDWRLPTREELRSLVDYSRSGPAIDTAYFPDVGHYGWYWSSSPDAGGRIATAWDVYFHKGTDGTDSRANGNVHVRLVRGGQDLRYVALGDSYSAGTGSAVTNDDYFPGQKGQCYRSKNAYSQERHGIPEGYEV